MRAGAELTMLRKARLSVQQSFRSEPINDRLYPSGTYTLSTNSLWPGALGAMIRYSRFENHYTTGDQQAISVSVAPLRAFDLRSEFGETSYSYLRTGTSISSKWVRASADVNLLTGSYFSIQAERNMSAASDGLRAFVEIGHRIR
ncbi:MAG: hypothetical protein IPG71_04505 [bacterium]|nr:hypothetical protein [bacterium]